MLLYREALRRGLGTDETTRAVIREAERQYLITLVTKRVTDTVRVTDNQVFDYYNRRKLDFATRLRFAYMVLPDEKTAQQTLKDLRRGRSFQELAGERSLERSANPGAELVVNGRNDTTVNLQPAFEDTLFTLHMGKVSGPIAVGGTYWLVNPLERTKLREAPNLDEVRDYLARFLELRYRRVVLDRALVALKKKTKVVLTPPRRDTTGFLASVGSDVLTRHYLELQLEGSAQLNPQELPRLLDVWTKSELLYQEAKRLGLGNDETTRVFFEGKRQDYLHNLLIERLLARVSVPPTEVFDYFQKHTDEYLHDVRILHILVGSDSVAQQLLTEAKRGADFQTLARERSSDRAASQGNESPYLDRLDPNLGLTPALEDVVFALKPDEIGPIVHTNQGYWLIKVTDRKKVRSAVTFEQAKDRIERFLFQQKSRQLVEDLLGDLRKTYQVVLFPGNYWS